MDDTTISIQETGGQLDTTLELCTLLYPTHPWKGRRRQDPLPRFTGHPHHGNHWLQITRQPLQISLETSAPTSSRTQAICGPLPRLQKQTPLFPPKGLRKKKGKHANSALGASGYPSPGPVGTRHRGQWVPVIEASGYPSLGPVGTRHWGQWVPVIGASGYPSSGPVGTRHRGQWVPVIGASG
ncbi:hypothetical protein ACOMHN_010265 [Nucella lapillus]